MSNTGLRSGSPVSIRIIAIVAGILAAGAVSLSASRALFIDTTESTANRFTVGTLVLTNDGEPVATLFDVTGMVPGQVVTNCIVVTYEGTIPDPGAVRLYSGGYTDPNGLDTALNLTVEEGTGGTYDDCTGFATPVTIEDDTIAGFDTTHVDYASGAGAWDPAATPESRSYRFTVELDPAASNDLQGAELSDLTFIWEIQST